MATRLLPKRNASSKTTLNAATARAATKVATFARTAKNRMTIDDGSDDDDDSPPIFDIVAGIGDFDMFADPGPAAPSPAQLKAIFADVDRQHFAPRSSLLAARLASSVAFKPAWGQSEGVLAADPNFAPTHDAWQPCSPTRNRPLPSSSTATLTSRSPIVTLFITSALSRNICPRVAVFR